jgi:hypothetical protein
MQRLSSLESLTSLQALGNHIALRQQYPTPHAGMLERLWMLNCKITNISPAVVLEQIRNTWFKPSKTTSDFDLEPAKLKHGFCTSS